MSLSRRRNGASSGAWAFIAQNPVLALLLVVALAILVAGQVRPGLYDGITSSANDAGAGAMSLVAEQAAQVKQWGEGVGSFLSTYDENLRLRAENARLRAAESELIELQRKVKRYEQLLNLPADAPVTSVAARVIADTSSPFIRTVLVNVGSEQGAAKGQAVVDDRGLLGRVIATGKRSSRVLLLTDLNSRIPVIIEGANLKAILFGDNTDRPTLEYLPAGSRIMAGARVITTSDGALFPPGVAIGTVTRGETSPRVQLFTNDGRADFVRVLNYKAPVDVNEEQPETGPDATDPATAPKAKPAAAPVPVQPVPPGSVSLPPAGLEGGRPG